MDNYTISSRAYTKMIFHAAKYPHCAVNGILLAYKNSTKGAPMQIVDAIPLFHQCLYVSPMAEIALIQIDAMAAEENLQIAGYYAASENYTENTIEKAPGLKLADKIVENCSDACFIVIDNAQICAQSGLKVYHHTENRWSKATCSIDQVNSTLKAVEELLQRGAMKDIVDFDNHLDNPENDWTNEYLNRDLKQLMAMY